MYGTKNANYKTAIFAGRCFWCTVSPFGVLQNPF